MDSFPNNFNEETLTQVAKETNEGKRRVLDANEKTQLATARPQVVEAIKLAAERGEREIVFELPDNLTYRTQLVLLRELLDRFPTKTFYWWCSISYADYDDWEKLDRKKISRKSAMGITNRYKIVL